MANARWVRSSMARLVLSYDRKSVPQPPPVFRRLLGGGPTIGLNADVHGLSGTYASAVTSLQGRRGRTGTQLCARSQRPVAARAGHRSRARGCLVVLCQKTRFAGLQEL